MRIGAKRDRQGVRGFGCVLALGAALLGLSACGGSGSGADEGHATPAHVTSLGGTVYGGRQPIANSAVAIYSAGLNPGDASVQIAATSTNASGTFTVSTFDPAPVNGQLVYVVVQGGDAGGGNNDAIRLMTLAGIWGDASFPGSVNINELSTVAAASVLQHQFTFPACAGITNNSLSGNCAVIPGAAGLAPRAASIANLVDVASGKVSTFLTSAADGTPLNLTLRKLNSLADIVAACVNSEGGVAGDGSSCGRLFDQAQPAADTLLAAFQIASSPVINARVGAIAGLLNLPFVYTPTIGGTPPADWTVAGKRYAYTGNDIDNNVSGYSVDDAGGVLSAVPGAPFSAGVGAGAAVQDSTGRFLFVANGPTTTTSGNSVSAYTIDPATGTLTAVAGSPFAAGNAPTALALAAGGKYLYVANSGTGQGISAYSVNATSGVLTPITVGARNCNDAGTPDPANCYAAGVAPTGLTVDPSGRYVYVANFYGNDVWAYTIDSGSGALVANGTAPAGNNPDALAASPDGKHLYVANEGGNNLSLYQIQADGSLAAGSCNVAPDAGNCYAGGKNPGSVKLSPDGRYAYASNAGNSGVSAWSVDSGSGALTPITGGAAAACGTTADPANCVPAGNTPAAVGVSADGRHVYVANRSDQNISAYAVDSVSGALTPLSLSSLAATGAQPTQVAIDPSGKFAYTSNTTDNTVSAFRIDAVTGALASVGSDTASVGNVVFSVTVHPGGRFVYVTNQNSLTISAYTLDAGSGALTPLAGGVDCNSEDGSGNCFIAGDGPSRVAFTPDGRFAYVPNYNGGDISAYSVTLSGANAGVLTPIAGAACLDLGPANDPHNCIASGTAQGVFGLEVDPSGLYLYAANQAHSGGGVLSYAINQTSGALTQLGTASLPYGPSAVAIDPNGHVYAGSFSVGSVAAYSIGGSGLLQTLTGGSGVDCTTFSGSGNCYFAGSQVFGVAADPLGRFLYTANIGGNDVSGFTIGSGGLLTPMTGAACNNDSGFSSSCYAAGNGPSGIVVDPTGRYTYVANQTDSTVQAYTIDAVSGALSPLSSASPYAAGQGPASLAFGP